MSRSAGCSNGTPFFLWIKVCKSPDGALCVWIGGDEKSRFTHRWFILLQFLSQPLWQCVARLLSPVSSFSEKKSRKTKSATQRPVVLDAYSQIDLIEALERQKGGRVRLALYGVNHKGRRLDWPSSLVIQPKEVEEL